MKKSFLGAGWAFPIDVESGGGIALCRDEENIRQSIKLILGTAVGERVMNPSFGCRVHDYVFYPNDASTAALVTYYVKEALKKWEPRIDSLQVNAYPDPTSENTMLISIDFRVIRTNNTDNLVFPFYLRREQDL
jgi:uncharacterized protein